MSNILSYSDKTARTGEEDWIAVDPYTDDDIQRIKDPDGGLSRNPRTAIPSPFAQLDLVKNAFAALSNPRLRGAAMNERLVSNALDVAQLFFDYENHKDYLRIVRWNRDEQLAQLKAGGRHRLYGETLELFLSSDKVYNFDDLRDWYILLCGSTVVGGTSPASIVMAAPVSAPIDAIKVEQGVTLFSTDRPLWQRDEEFVYYMYVLMNAYPVLRRKAGMVYSYMLHNLDYIKRERPALYSRITQSLPNPQALDEARAATLLETLEQTYDRFGGAADVSVLGARFYHRRVADIRIGAGESDFVIQPTMPQPAGKSMPLVLCTGFNGSVEHYRYIDREWDSATEVIAAGVPIDSRKLPDTSIQYPFITTADFLAESIVRVNNAIDACHFFDGNLKSSNRESTHGYLLPLKPEFFRWFRAGDLKHQVAGRNMLDIEEHTDGSVMVTLRVPVKKRYIELTRRYFAISDHTWTFDERRGTGRVVDAIINTAVFPFVRTSRNDDYTVQLFSMISGGSASLRFVCDGGDTSSLQVTSKQRARTVYTTEYYDVNGTWDYAEATINCDLGSFTGVILPMWKAYTPSARELIFAVDFGTTNTHLEWAERGQMSEPLTFADGSEQVLVASLLKKGGLDIAEQLQRIEFLPQEIDNVYGFPLRSALAGNVGNDGGRSLFKDVNIPFLYERKFFDGYEVTTGLKWMGDTTPAKEFLRELTLLIKAKTLLENVDLRNVHVVYFYPVSMGGSDRRKLQDTWEELFRTYLGDNAADNLQAYPESIAPAYYYKSADVTGSSYVSIDIGGGTSDTVIYQPTPDGMRSEPVAISSFRFAGNAIFGDAFGERDADNNPLLQHYTRYFSQIIANDRSTGIAYLTSIMQDIMRGKRSEDINAFLFSIENVEELRDLREIDRNLYSYNVLLRNDAQRKLIFIYFYAAIIYYIAHAMKARDFVMPKQIYFSGTGSKILNILGAHSQVVELTQTIIERVYGTPYAERFEIKIETECPKQITCRGGIKLENQRLDGRADTRLYSPRNVNAIKYCYSMLSGRQLTYADMNDAARRNDIVLKVKEFNEFFIALCDKVTKDEFGIDNSVFRIFCDVLNDDIANYLTAGINTFLHGRYEAADVIEDVPFFYPIVGVIRYNLLKNLNNDNISRFRNGNNS